MQQRGLYYLPHTFAQNLRLHFMQQRGLCCLPDAAQTNEQLFSILSEAYASQNGIPK